MKRGFSPQTVTVGKGEEKSGFWRHFTDGNQQTWCNYYVYTWQLHLIWKKKMTWWYLCWERDQRYRGAMTWVHLSFFKMQSGKFVSDVWNCWVCGAGRTLTCKCPGWPLGMSGLELRGAVGVSDTDEGVTELLLLLDGSSGSGIHLFVLNTRPWLCFLFWTIKTSKITFKYLTVGQQFCIFQESNT